MNNKTLDHNASNQLNQPLTALAKTKTFMWVQNKVRRKIKHIQLWKLGKATKVIQNKKNNCVASRLDTPLGGPPHGCVQELLV